MPIVLLRFLPPDDPDLAKIIVGESTTATGSLSDVASGTDIGSSPDYITSFSYASGIVGNYYAVKWEDVNGTQGDFTSRLKFDEGENAGEFTFFIFNKAGDKSVFLMPASGTMLDKNTEYTITVKAGLSGVTTFGLQEEFCFYFTSAFCPLWTTVIKVRLEIGSYIRDLPDDTINRIIHNNSLLAFDIFTQAGGSFVSECPCNEKDTSYEMARFVLCKTSLDALNAVALGAGGGGGSKTLGDLSIKYGTGSDNSGLPRKRKELDLCMTQMMGSFANVPRDAVHGKFDTSRIHPISTQMWGRLRRRVDTTEGLLGPHSRSFDWIGQNRGRRDLTRVIFGVRGGTRR